MKLPFRTTLSRQEPVKRSRLKRVLRGTLYVKLGLLVFLAVALGLFYLRLSAAPMSFGRLPERVAEALAERIGPGWNVTLRNTAIELHDGSPALRANGLDIRAPGGDLVLRAPYAILSVDLMSLLTANLQPKAIEVRDLQLRVLVNRDGSLTFSPVPGGDGDRECGSAACRAGALQGSRGVARPRRQRAVAGLGRNRLAARTDRRPLQRPQLPRSGSADQCAPRLHRCRRPRAGPVPACGCRLRLGGERRSPVRRDGGGRPGPLAAERRRHCAGQGLLPRRASRPRPRRSRTFCC